MFLSFYYNFLCFVSFLDDIDTFGECCVDRQLLTLKVIDGIFFIIRFVGMYGVYARGLIGIRELHRCKVGECYRCGLIGIGISGRQLSI